MDQYGKVLVVGGGTMGAGIAVVLASAGAKVKVVEAGQEAAHRAFERVRAGLERRGQLTALAQLEVEVGLPTKYQANLVVEAVPEDVEVKKSVFVGLRGVVPRDALIATNTSCLSIDELARAVEDESRFVGMHFFNPVGPSYLVEIVVGSASSARALEEAKHWVKVVGKEYVVVRDSPGFATSRLGVLMGLEAMRMVEEGVAAVADIDRAMELGYRFPMGPLKLSDLVGLDVRLAIAERLAVCLGDRFVPPAVLRDKVRRGDLGLKTGKGFYEWGASGARDHVAT